MGNLVVKDNALIEASHRLGEVEQRLVLLAILKARNVGDTVEQLKDKMLTIHADDYITNFGGTRQGAYKALKQAVMGLYRAEWGYKYLTDKGEQRVRYERFTQSADYGEGEGTVKFMFSTAIIPMLVELERRFTSYEIGQVAQLSSQYAMRLYEFFMRHLDKKTGAGWLDISLDDLRFRFGLLPNEYKTMSNFKSRVLDYAIKEVNENTDLSATYTQKKQGRIIVGFHFEFNKKSNAKPKKTKENTDRDPNTIDFLTGKTDKEREIVAQKNAYADQIGATAEHRENLIRQGLEQHRQAEQRAKEQKERSKAKRLAQERQDKERLELAKQQFEQILSDDRLINAYIAHNLNPKYLNGLQKSYYEQGNFRGVVEMERYKFEELHHFKYVNLEFLK
ncbi:replication initiation protein RepM [Pasteurella multocida]|nr:replication initiation protein RepM [Pasteurella multocida]MDY0568460.1 replication initiation protein RepM [Pasteurella multocida]